MPFVPSITTEAGYTVSVINRDDVGALVTLDSDGQAYRVIAGEVYLVRPHGEDPFVKTVVCDMQMLNGTDISPTLAILDAYREVLTLLGEEAKRLTAKL